MMQARAPTASWGPYGLRDGVASVMTLSRFRHDPTGAGQGIDVAHAILTTARSSSVTSSCERIAVTVVVTQ